MKQKLLLLSTILLIGLYVFFLFYRLGVHPFIDFDESIYGNVVKEILRNGHWFNLHYYGQLWFEKPIFGFWLMAISSKLFGVNEWAMRLPAALATTATVILSIRWVYELRKSYVATLLTMGCYFIMFPLFTDSYFAGFDTLVTLFIFLTFYFWWKKWYVWWGIALGLAVMTKSVIGLTPLLPIGVYQLINKDLAFIKTKRFWYGSALAAVIILPWHIFQSFLNGKQFWNNYFFYHVVKRFNSSLETNGEPWWFYIQVVFLRYYLAAVVFGGSLLAAVIDAWKNKTYRLLVLGSVVLFVLLSSSITKISPYIDIVLPMLVMIAGIYTEKLINLLPKTYLKIFVCTILLGVFVYTGWQFNRYKIAQGEFFDQFFYTANKKIGLFLKDYHTELPAYTDAEISNGGLGYYADRPIIADKTKTIVNDSEPRVFHANNTSVFLKDDRIVIVHGR